MKSAQGCLAWLVLGGLTLGSIFASAAQAAAPGDDPFVGDYLGTFHPQGWSAGDGLKTGPDKPEIFIAAHGDVRHGIEPTVAKDAPPRDLMKEEAMKEMAKQAAAEPPKTEAAPAADKAPQAKAAKRHRCAACHTVATVRRVDDAYALTFMINHGNDKEGKLIRERIELKAEPQADKLLFQNEKYHVTLADGKLSGQRIGRMSAPIELARMTDEQKAAEAEVIKAATEPAKPKDSAKETKAGY